MHTDQFDYPPFFRIRISTVGDQQTFYKEDGTPFSESMQKQLLYEYRRRERTVIVGNITTSPTRTSAISEPAVTQQTTIHQKPTNLSPLPVQSSPSVQKASSPKESGFGSTPFLAAASTKNNKKRTKPTESLERLLTPMQATVQSSTDSLTPHQIQRREPPSKAVPKSYSQREPESPIRKRPRSLSRPPSPHETMWQSRDTPINLESLDEAAHFIERKNEVSYIALASIEERIKKMYPSARNLNGQLRNHLKEIIQRDYADEAAYRSTLRSSDSQAAGKNDTPQEEVHLPETIAENLIARIRSGQVYISCLKNFGPLTGDLPTTHPDYLECFLYHSLKKAEQEEEFEEPDDLPARASTAVAQQAYGKKEVIAVLNRYAAGTQQEPDYDCLHYLAEQLEAQAPTQWVQEVPIGWDMRREIADTIILLGVVPDEEMLNEFKQTAEEILTYIGES